jgi:hypothetical protein
LAGELIEELVQITDLTITYSPGGSPPVRALDHASLGIHQVTALLKIDLQLGIVDAEIDQVANTLDASATH